MSTTENSLPSDDVPVTPNSEPLQTDPILKVPPRHQASTGEIPGTSEGSNAAPHSTISPRQARQRRNVPMPNMEVLAIDDALGIQTEIDKARDKFLDLVESLKTGRYLTDKIQGVEKHSGLGEPRAVIFHGDYKVIIMASMIVDLPKDLRGQDPNEVYHYLLTKRLGSEIDYVVKGIDRNTGLAVGSRKDAMATKRRHYYLNQTRDGTYRIYEGLCCEARVMNSEVEIPEPDAAQRTEGVSEVEDTADAIPTEDTEAAAYPEEGTVPVEPDMTDGTVSGIPIAHLALFGGGLIVAVAALVGIHIFQKRREGSCAEDDDENDEI